MTALAPIMPSKPSPCGRPLIGISLSRDSNRTRLTRLADNNCMYAIFIGGWGDLQPSSHRNSQFCHLSECFLIDFIRKNACYPGIVSVSLQNKQAEFARSTIAVIQADPDFLHLPRKLKGRTWTPRDHF